MYSRRSLESRASVILVRRGVLDDSSSLASAQLAALNFTSQDSRGMSASVDRIIVRFSSNTLCNDQG